MIVPYNSMVVLVKTTFCKELLDGTSVSYLTTASTDPKHIFNHYMWTAYSSGLASTKQSSFQNTGGECDSVICLSSPLMSREHCLLNLISKTIAWGSYDQMNKWKISVATA